MLRLNYLLMLTRLAVGCALGFYLLGYPNMEQAGLSRQAAKLEAVGRVCCLNKDALPKGGKNVLSH